MAWVVFIPHLQAQSEENDLNLRFELFELPGGVLGNNVNCVVQDSLGFLWFASHGGLHRYDGHRFKTFRHDPRDSTSLSMSYAEWVHIDRFGVLWVGTYGGGLNRYDMFSESFTRYRNDPDDHTTISHDYVSMIVDDKQGNIWIATNEGLNMLDRNQGIFSRYYHDPEDPTSLSCNFVRCVYVDKDGTLWAGTGDPFNPNWDQGGLNRFHPDSKTFSRFLSEPGNEQSLINHKVKAIFEDSKGNFWVGSGENGLHQLDRRNNIFTRFHSGFKSSGPKAPTLNSLITYPNYHISFISEDQKGNIWIGAVNGGINVYEPDGKVLHHFEAEEGNESTIGNNFIWDYYQTSDGTIWICTGGGGGQVFKVVDWKDPFKYLKPLFSMVCNYNGFLKDSRGNLWAATDPGGLMLKPDHEKEPVSMYLHDEFDRSSIQSNNVWAICEDEEGYLWIIFRNPGGEQPLLLDRYDPVSQHFSHYEYHPEFTEHTTWNDTYRMILNDKAGNIWITSIGAGLIRFNKENLTFTQLLHQENNSQSIQNDKVFSIYQENDGTLWVGGGDRPGFLNRLDPQTLKFEDPIKPPIIQNSFVFDIDEDQEGRIWFALYENGLGRLDLQTGETNYFNYNSSQIPTDVRNMIFADDGRLWLSTTGNVIRLDPGSMTYFMYEMNPVIGAPWNYQSAYRSPTGELYFGNYDRFLTFDPSKVVSRESQYPHVILTDFLLYNESQIPRDKGLLKDPIWNTESINLSFEDRSFTFQFSCHDYRATNSQYEFYLEGYDQNWRRPANDPEAAYVRVPPGKYTFRVRAANSEGIWSEEKSLKVVIWPPWWRSWWAYSGYSLGFLGLLFWIRKTELEKQNRRLQLQANKLEHEQQVNQQLRRVDQLKDQFLANTSHELRTPLHGIIGLSEAMHNRSEIRQDRDDLSMVISSGKRLASLVDDILDFSRLKNFDIELVLKPVDMRAITDVVLRVVQPLVLGKDLIMKNEIPGNLPTVKGDENRLQQILHNLIGNALKFTESGIIRVSGEVDQGMVIISVEDTGIGIPEDKHQVIFQEFIQADGTISREFAGTGLGLSVSQRLVELHKGKMWLESTVGQGSTFYFSLPISGEKAVDISQNESLSQLVTGIDDSDDNGRVILTVPDSHKINILVVDDEPINQQVLKNHLSATQYRVFQAMNGKEALKLIESGQHFDLVLLDVMMPRMSGFEVCERLRKKYLPNELPVILVTAKNQVKDLVEGLSTGANDYLAKPFTKDEFLARVNTHLNLHRINSATGKFVPNQFLRSLGRNTITEVTLGDHIEREVTVMFCDIRDYTALSEHMTPTENFKFVNAFNGRMGPVIHKHRGFVNQYLGDAIMALFPEKPEDALEAGIEMHKVLRKYNEGRRRKNLEPVRMGVGMHTGRLIMGIIGDELRMEAATIADTVNSASRIESLTKHYGTNILLSEESLKRMKEQHTFHLRYLGKVQVKGSETPIGIYECFDGDVPSIAEKKRATQKLFGQGLEHYYAKDFTQALVAFKEVLSIHPDDPTTKILLHNAARLVSSGVPEEWTGVELMTAK